MKLCERHMIWGLQTISADRFDAVIVKKRVQNTLGLYAKQKRLINVVVDQIYEKEEKQQVL